MKNTYRILRLIAVSLCLVGCYTFKDDPAFVRADPDGGEGGDPSSANEIALSQYSTVEISSARDVVATTGTLFALGSDEFAVYDISTPSSPTLQSGNTNLNYSKNAALAGTMLFVLDSELHSNQSRLSVYDVTSTATDPEMLNRLEGLPTYDKMLTLDGKLYLMRSGSITVYPATVEPEVLQDTPLSEGELLDFTIASGHLYASWISSNYTEDKAVRGFTIASTGELSSPTDIPMEYTAEAMGGNDSYLAIGESQKLHLFSISLSGSLSEIQPSADIDWNVIFGDIEEEVASFHSKSQHEFKDIAIDGNTVYVAGGDRVSLFSISGTSFSFLGRLSVDGDFIRVDETNDLLYVGDSSGGIDIFARY